MIESNRFSLKGKVVVITGGAGLLGKMHAEAVAEAGGSVVLADIKKDLADAVAEEIRLKYNTEILTVRVDITSKEEVENLLAKTLKQFSKVDVLINNAANNPKVQAGETGDDSWTRLENFPIDSWTQDLAVGLTGTFLCSQVLGAEMAKRESGNIINISSDLGLVAPDQRLYQEEDTPEELQPVKPITYSVVKTGIIGLTRYLATYWAHKNIRVNALCPGGVEEAQSEEFKMRIHQRIPLGRMAKRDEYKGAIIFLASEASSYMTGSILAVEGGRTCW